MEELFSVKSVSDALEFKQEMDKKKREEAIADNKLIKEIQGNKNLCKFNRTMFEEEEKKFNSCYLYNPCPICDKCQNKASHLYVKCQTCKIPICTHTYKDRKFMIRRDNFKLNVSKEVEEKIKRKSDEVIKKEGGDKL